MEMTKKRVARVEEELLSACHLSLVPLSLEPQALIKGGYGDAGKIVDASDKTRVGLRGLEGRASGWTSPRRR